MPSEEHRRPTPCARCSAEFGAGKPQVPLARDPGLPGSPIPVYPGLRGSPGSGLSPNLPSPTVAWPPPQPVPAPRVAAPAAQPLGSSVVSPFSCSPFRGDPVLLLLTGVSSSCRHGLDAAAAAAAAAPPPNGRSRCHRARGGGMKGRRATPQKGRPTAATATAESKMAARITPIIPASGGRKGPAHGGRGPSAVGLLGKLTNENAKSTDGQSQPDQPRQAKI
ncbi:cortexin domain containing 2 isoform X1 [Cavia porcellus]|uniref:cortexin domain containing 2 isoform X1 n=1 Tax=Cavia porcellus TaxID=10141 RepID=UPI002FE387DC